MFDHLGIDVNDYEASKKFYTAALAPLGIKLIKDLKEWNAAGFGKDHPGFWIGKGEPSSHKGEMHLCFAAKSRAEVKAFYDAAIKAGATDNGKPGLRPEYHEHYYGAFVHDLNGVNLEACCHTPE